MSTEKFVARKDTVDKAVSAAAVTSSNTPEKHHQTVMATLMGIQDILSVAVPTPGITVTRRRVAA